MDQNQIKEMQHRIGTSVDGFWGPKSIAACKLHLRSLMPKVNPWPAPDQGSLTDFYGLPGDESKLTNIDLADICVKYDGMRVRSIRCHKKVADSLLRVIQAIYDGPDSWALLQYAGVYNNRKMRGGSLPSLHARGAAIDLAPSTNGNHAAWPVACTMPLVVMEAFAKEGWKSAGAFWGRDAMHHEATR